LKTNKQKISAFLRYKERVEKEDQARSDKGSSRSPLNTAKKSLTSFRTSLVKIEEKWDDNEKWDKKSKVAFRKELEELKKQIEVFLEKN
jgi:hypothetical protein